MLKELSTVLCWDGMGAAIEGTVFAAATDARLEEISLGFRALQALHCGRVDSAIVVVGGLQTDDHVPLRLVVADAGNVAVFAHFGAGKCVQRDRAVVLHLNGFGCGCVAHQHERGKQ